jgi:hypothetical protein
MKVALSLPSKLGRFIHRTVRARSQLKACNALMEQVVGDFPNVTSLVIADIFGVSQQSQLVLNACTAYASKLRTLIIIAKSPNFTAHFPPNPSEFMSLEEVAFIFWDFTGTADYDIPSKFFQAVASRLTTLQLIFRRKHSCFDLSQLLQRFLSWGSNPAFPKLTSLSLYHLGRSPTPPGSNLLEFLNQHAATLKYLSLEYSTSSDYASQSLGDPLSPVLPHLETLIISKVEASRRSEELASHEAVRAYVQHSGSTLTSLTLTHGSFALHDLGIFLDLLGRRSSQNAEDGRLKSLTITVLILSPQLLDMLAEKLPQLEELMINFVHLRSKDSADVPTWMTSSEDVWRKNHEVHPCVMSPFGPNLMFFLSSLIPQNIKLFLLEMKTRSYFGWKLRSIGMNRVPGDFNPEITMSFFTPLGMCFPHLVEIAAPMKMWRDSPGSTAWKLDTDWD